MSYGSAYVIDLTIEAKRPHRVVVANEPRPKTPFRAGGVVYVLERVERIEREEEGGEWSAVLTCDKPSQVVVLAM